MTLAAPQTCNSMSHPDFIAVYAPGEPTCPACRFTDGALGDLLFRLNAAVDALSPTVAALEPEPTPAPVQEVAPTVAEPEPTAALPSPTSVADLKRAAADVETLIGGPATAAVRATDERYPTGSVLSWRGRETAARDYLTALQERHEADSMEPREVEDLPAPPPSPVETQQAAPVATPDVAENVAQEPESDDDDILIPPF